MSIETYLPEKLVDAPLRRRIDHARQSVGCARAGRTVDRAPASLR